MTTKKTTATKAAKVIAKVETKIATWEIVAYPKGLIAKRDGKEILRVTAKKDETMKLYDRLVDRNLIPDGEDRLFVIAEETYLATVEKETTPEPKIATGNTPSRKKIAPKIALPVDPRESFKILADLPYADDLDLRCGKVIESCAETCHAGIARRCQAMIALAILNDTPIMTDEDPETLYTLGDKVDELSQAGKKKLVSTVHALQTK